MNSLQQSLKHRAPNLSTTNSIPPYRSSPSPDSAILLSDPLIPQHPATLAARQQRESHSNMNNTHLSNNPLKATQQEIAQHTRIEKFTPREIAHLPELFRTKSPSVYLDYISPDIQARIRDRRPCWWKKGKRAVMKEKIKEIWKNVRNVLKEVNIKLGESRGSGGGFVFAGGR